jgi:hypothetical protein
VRAGAGHLEAISGDMPQQSLGHLAARRVAGAKEQDLLFDRGDLLLD